MNFLKKYKPSKLALIASTAIATAVISAAPTAYANGCSPSLTGTSGNDTITCTGTQVSGNAGIVRAEAGDDTINVTDANSAGVNWDVEGDEGSDTITVTNSTINDLRADSATGSGENSDDGNDVITFTNSTLTEQLYLAGGNDTFSATGSTINDLYIGSGNDTVTLNNSTVDTFVTSASGNDTITLTNGSLIDSSVNIGDGLDTVVLDNSTIDGSLTVGNSSSDDGADTVTLSNNSEVDGNINLGEGNDMLTATNSVIDGTINSTGGDDTIILTNVTELNGLNISEGADTVTLVNTDLTSSLTVGTNNVNDGADTVTITMSDVNGSVFLGEANDSLTATDSIINGSISSTGGDDTVILTNVMDVNSINISDGADTVVLDNTTLSGQLDVGVNGDTDGADNVTLRNNSNVGTSIDLGSQNDVLTASDSRINGSIFSSDGDDTVSLTNVIDVNSISIDEGADTVLLDNTILSGTLDVGLNNDNDGADNVTVTNGSSIGGTVDLGFDDDIVTISGGSFIGGPVRGGAGNDTILVTGAGTLVDGSDVFGGDGNDVITIASGAMVGGSSGTEGVVGGDGDDIVNIDGGIVSGFVNLENGDDTAVFDAASTINTTATFFVEGDAGSDNITVNGGTYDAGIQLGVSGDDPADFDELVINGGTINGPIQFGQGNDLVTVNGGTLTEGLGVVGTEFNEDTITINGGVIGTSNAGNAIFTGVADDQVGIFGGDVQSTISLGGDNDLVVIDAGGDEFAGAMTQVFVQNGFTNETAPTLDLDHSVTGGALIATPTEFLGGTGDDVAEIFDLVETENLDFESFNDVNIYGLSISLADDAFGEQSQSIDYLRLLRGSTLTQTSGRLDIVAEGGTTGGVATLIVDGTSRVTLQDGVTDDFIALDTFAPQAGSVLAVDVDVVSRGFQADDSDYIIGSVHTPEAGAIVNVNTIGNADLSGSRRIVDGGADVNDPGVGAVVNASSTYVLQNDPSTGARRFWLQDGEDGGVYLVWTTPVSPLTSAAVLGGAISGAAIGPDGKIDLSDPNLVVDPDAPGAGLTALTASQTGSFIADAFNHGNGGQSLDCATGRKGVNVWGTIGAETGEYGQNEIDTGRAVVGAEKDLSNALKAECGRFKVGTFLYTSHSEIDQPLIGSDNEANAYGAGLYLKASTDSNFYGSVMGYIGQTDYQGVNAVLESRFDYDSDDWGARLDVGKVMPLNKGNMTVDIRGYVGISSSSADSFIDSVDFETTSIDDESISYGASVGLAKPFENNQRVYGRLGVDFSNIDSELVAFDIPVTSSPSYTLGRAELGYENSTANGRGTLRIGVNGRLGSEVEAYGASVTGIVRF